MQPIPKGTVLLVTDGPDGPHGDERTWGIYLAKEDIDPAALLEEWLQAHPGERSRYGFYRDEFWHWVVSKGVVEDMPYKKWWLGEGSASDMAVSP